MIRCVVNVKVLEDLMINLVYKLKIVSKKWTK